jgi:hypothetical protein
MWARCKQFWLPKRGNSESEYEDAFWLPKKTALAHGTIRLAVADGATETSYAGLWARLLVRSYGKYGYPVDPLDPGLASARSIWRRCLSTRALPWYAEEKIRMGAFSTLLGLSLTVDDVGNFSAGSWTAHAVGDSCLFQVQAGGEVVAFPLTASGEFSSRPALLSSVAASASGPCEGFTANGVWKYGDVFYLMTDALACWFLASLERRSDPVELLRSHELPEDFPRLIAHLRSHSAEDGAPVLRNDDVTMVVCEMIRDEPMPAHP